MLDSSIFGQSRSERLNVHSTAPPQRALLRVAVILALASMSFVPLVDAPVAHAAACPISFSAPQEERVRPPLKNDGTDRFSVKGVAVDLRGVSGSIEVQVCRDGQDFDLTGPVTFFNATCASTPTDITYNPPTGSYEAQTVVRVNGGGTLRSGVSRWTVGDQWGSGPIGSDPC
jgi:hypothetical protein